MKIIDLLNRIANGEEVPKKIKYENKILYFDNEDNEDNNYHATFNYYDEEGNNELFTGWVGEYLNDEVEIIEEDKKIEPKPITKKDLEAIGYAFGEMKKTLQNGWDKSLNNEPFKEDEKIKTINDFTTNVGVVDESNVEEYIHILFEQETILYFKINEIIDVINRGD